MAALIWFCTAVTSSVALVELAASVLSACHSGSSLAACAAVTALAVPSRRSVPRVNWFRTLSASG